MQKPDSILLWLKENREMAIEVLRIYLGIALLIKGIQFIIDDKVAAEYMTMVNLPFFEFFSMHVIAVVHIAGGGLLAIGLISRIAALIQIPIILGAIFLVHFQQGLFTKEQSLEFVILVLVLLITFVIYGSGRLSVDYVLESRDKNHG
jgi:putative oxidoreductase